MPSDTPASCASTPPRFAAASGRLTAATRAAYARDGFVLLEGFVDDNACADLMARAEQLTEEADLRDVATVFSTGDHRHAADDYFITSGDKIRFFFEDGAFDANGRLRRAKRLSVNKIGHALHDLDPVFDRFSRQPAMAGLAADLGIAEPLLLQSMYIFKQPHIGGEVVCHTDATFLITEPPSVVGFWFALQDATIDNGCLWALPGFHRQPPRARFHRTSAGLRLDVLDPTPWPMAQAVPLEAKRGTLVLLHGFLPHYSGPNRSTASRHAYTLHVIDGACAYAPDNWLRRGRDLPLRGF